MLNIIFKNINVHRLSIIVARHFYLILSIWDPIQKLNDFQRYNGIYNQELNGQQEKEQYVSNNKNIIITDPLSSSMKSSKFEPQFVFPFIVFLTFLIDSSFMFVVLDYKILNSELYYFNRIYPFEFHRMGNSIIIVSSLMSLLIYALLMIGTQLDNQWKMFLNNNNSNSKSSNKIIYQNNQPIGMQIYIIIRHY